MHLECPQCSKSLDESQIDIFANIVTCDACGAVFSTPDQAPIYHDKKKHDYSDIPKQFTVHNTPDSLHIAYKHNACAGIALGFFALFWNGILWIFFVPTFGVIGIQGISDPSGMGWIGLIFPLFLIPFLFIGAWIGYQALFLILNKTTVSATHKALKIQHRPLSIPFDKVIETATIDQLFTKRHVTSGSSGDTITYQVHIKTSDGKTKKLLSGFSEPKPALYIEHEIEAFLGIEDRYIEGQYE